MIRLNFERWISMRSSSQFTTPAYIGGAVAVIIVAVIDASHLPPELRRPEVIAAISGLSSALASSLASYVNAVCRERFRRKQEGKTE
jgi:hypothetical protein